VIASGPGQLPGILGTLAPLLHHYGYLLVAGLIFVEDFGVLVPGETVLIVAAAYAGAGRLSITVVALVGATAAILGDTVGYAAGHHLGRARVLRWGRYLLLTDRRLAAAERFFIRNGGKIVAIARFVDGLRQVNGIVAGIAGMPLRRFLVFNALGALLWVGTWSAVGYLAGNHLQAVYQQFTRYSLVPVAAAGAIPLVLGALAAQRHRGRPAAGGAIRANPEPATEASGSGQGRSRWSRRRRGSTLEP
jgi:membrane protein DedA with SNARE-associated domain